MTSFTGPQTALRQKAGVAKASNVGLPEATASAIVMPCISGSGVDEVSIASRFGTSASMGCTDLGAGLPTAIPISCG